MPINTTRFISLGGNTQQAGQQRGGNTQSFNTRFIPLAQASQRGLLRGRQPRASQAPGFLPDLAKARFGAGITGLLGKGLGPASSGSSVANIIGGLSSAAQIPLSLLAPNLSDPRRALGTASGVAGVASTLVNQFPRQAANVLPTGAASVLGKAGPVLQGAGGALSLAEGDIGQGLGNLGVAGLSLLGVPGAQMLAIPLIFAALSKFGPNKTKQRVAPFRPAIDRLTQQIQAGLAAGSLSPSETFRDTSQPFNQPLFPGQHPDITDALTEVLVASLMRGQGSTPPIMSFDARKVARDHGLPLNTFGDAQALASRIYQEGQGRPDQFYEFTNPVISPQLPPSLSPIAEFIKNQDPLRSTLISPGEIAREGRRQQSMGTLLGDIPIPQEYFAALKAQEDMASAA